MQLRNREFVQTNQHKSTEFENRYTDDLAPGLFTAAQDEYEFDDEMDDTSTPFHGAFNITKSTLDKLQVALNSILETFESNEVQGKEPYIKNILLRFTAELADSNECSNSTTPEKLALFAAISILSGNNYIARYNWLIDSFISSLSEQEFIALICSYDVHTLNQLYETIDYKLQMLSHQGHDDLINRLSQQQKRALHIEE